MSAVWQVMLIQVLMWLPLLATAMLLPWRTALANASEIGMVLALVIFVQVAAFIIDAENDAGADDMAAVLMIPLVECFLAAFLVLSYSAIRRFVPNATYGIFLCHHKEGAGSLARYMKMKIPTSTRVYLNADELESVEGALEAVRSKTQNFVVLLTKMVLSQPWCCGEIVVADGCKVPMVAVECDDWAKPDKEALGKIDALWSEYDKHRLGFSGILKYKIADACNMLVEMETIPMPRFKPAADQDAQISKLLDKCNKSGGISAGSAGSAEYLVAGSSVDAEARCTCEVLRNMVSAKTSKVVTVAFSSSDAKHTHVEPFNSRWCRCRS